MKRGRAGVAAAAAIGATALFAPGAAHAGVAVGTFEVNTLADHAADGCDPLDTSAETPTDCTLRDAVSAANGNANGTTPDTITFASGLTGTIRLTQGEITIDGAQSLSINGPGRSVITVSGDADDSGTPNSGDSRIFHVQSSSLSGGDITLSGLTFTGGFGSTGGAIRTDFGPNVTVANSDLSGNTSPGTDGGAIYAGGRFTLTGSDVSGNHADADGGGIWSGDLLTVSDSTLSGNTASNGGGIASAGKYAQTKISDSTISGNTGDDHGGGLYVHQRYSYECIFSGDCDRPTKHAVKSEIANTTIDHNHTHGSGGGIAFNALGDGDKFTVTHSTISGNDATVVPPTDVVARYGSTYGGGIAFLSYEGYATIGGDFDAIDSTISGNTADNGGGVAFAYSGSQVVTENGSVAFDNSTIASNTARQNGGGIYLNAYQAPNDPGVYTTPTVDVTSTIVADNKLGDGTGQDLDRGQVQAPTKQAATTFMGGGVDASYSLVENKGDVPITETPAGSNLIGVDPALGALGDNGGPTETHMPSDTSPVVDQGKAPARLLTDQRGHDRTVQGDAQDAQDGDGTDIGAVEVDNPAKNPPQQNPPQQNPPVGQPTTPQIITPNNEDELPIARIKKNRLRSQKNPFVRGVASDDHQVDKVEVAIVKKRRNRCKELKPSLHFTKWHRCGRPTHFLTAEGTTKWKFKLDRTLNRGYYVVYSRATDNKGQEQKTFTTRSRWPFRVRRHKH